jgi:hypothetical protein
MNQQRTYTPGSKVWAPRSADRPMWLEVAVTGDTTGESIDVEFTSPVLKVRLPLDLVQPFAEPYPWDHEPKP